MVPPYGETTPLSAEVRPRKMSSTLGRIRQRIGPGESRRSPVDRVFSFHSEVQVSARAAGGRVRRVPAGEQSNGEGGHNGRQHSKPHRTTHHPASMHNAPSWRSKPACATVGRGWSARQDYDCRRGLASRAAPRLHTRGTRNRRAAAINAAGRSPDLTRSPLYRE